MLLLAAGIFCFLTITRLAQPGMFLDGLTYAAVARNLAQGIGSFWSPSYTSTLYSRFFEQPPLGLALQAAAFAVFGDHIAVERVYSLVMGCLTAVLIAAIWRSTMAAPRYAWLPIFFWLLPSTVTWSIVNNMLENTQAVFTTLAVFAFVHSLRPGAGGYGWGAVAGLAILGAVLTKGPVGLFPLAAPPILAMVMPNRKRDAMRSAAAMLVSLAVGSAIILAQAAARAGLGAYWQQQVWASVTGARERAASRWVLADHLLGGVLVRMGGALMLIWLYSRNRNDRSRVRPAGWCWFFLGVALAGSLPIAVSAKIMGVYLVPSIPFYALTSASLTLSLIQPALDRRRSSTKRIPVAGLIGGALVVGSIALPIAWGPLEARDVTWIAEFRSLSSSMPRGATLGTCEAVRTNFGLHAYMQRLFQVSLDPESTGGHRFYLRLTDARCDAPTRCRPIATSGRLALLQCDD